MSKKQHDLTYLIHNTKRYSYKISTPLSLKNGQSDIIIRFVDIVDYLSNLMATAYVLINCELGSEEAIIQQLKGLDGVKEVHGTFGAYDILAKIESDTVEKLRETITWKIRKIEKIRSTLTLMGIEGQT